MGHMSDSTTVARLACDEATARRLAAALGEALDTENAVCAAFEGDGGQWQLAIHFRVQPVQQMSRRCARWSRSPPTMRRRRR